MDRRTQDSKLLGRAILEGMRKGEVELALSRYIRADRCRICRLGDSDQPNADHVRMTIDQELMNNATYRAALDAVEPFVAEWLPDEWPTCAAVRNHARRHLKRDQAQVRALMEAYALDAGIDVEQDAGSIISPGGVLALITQKGYEQLRDGGAVPTIGETIQASRALNAIKDEQRQADLERERERVRLLVALLEELAPGALGSVTRSRPELLGAADDGVVVVPDADAVDPPSMDEQASGFACDQCDIVAKTRGGLLQHKQAKHRDPTIPNRRTRLPKANKEGGST